MHQDNLMKLSQKKRSQKKTTNYKELRHKWMTKKKVLVDQLSLSVTYFFLEFSFKRCLDVV